MEHPAEELQNHWHSDNLVDELPPHATKSVIAQPGPANNLVEELELLWVPVSFHNEEEHTLSMN